MCSLIDRTSLKSFAVMFSRNLGLPLLALGAASVLASDSQTAYAPTSSDSSATFETSQGSDTTSWTTVNANSAGLPVGWRMAGDDGSSVELAVCITIHVTRAITLTESSSTQATACRDGKELIQPWMSPLQ